MKSNRRRSCGTALHRLFALCALYTSLMAAAGATHLWTGNGLGNFWSEPANWQGTNAPQPGEAAVTLVFPAGSARLTCTNDVEALGINQLSLFGTGYVLAGTNALAFPASQPVAIQADGLTNRVTLPLVFQGTNGIEVAATASLQLAGFLGGPGGFALLGGGVLDLAPVANRDNTYAGPTMVLNGVLQLDSGRTNNALGYIQSVAVPGPLIIGQSNSSALAVARGGSTGTNVALTLLGSGQWQGGANLGSLEGNGLMALQQEDLTVGNSDASMVFSGQFTNGPGGGGLVKAGAGSLALTGSALGNAFLDVLPPGELIVDGDFSLCTVFDASTLAGNGNVGFLLADGLVSPGDDGPGRLTGNMITFDLNSRLLAELAGTNAGIDYDQLVAETSLSFVDPSAALEVKLLPGFVGSIGNRYTIIRNDGAEPVAGVFSGLPEGAAIYASNGAGFQISYTGGDGNDVVLTQTSLPPQPKFVSVTELGGAVQLYGTGFSNTSYSVWAGTNLADAHWWKIGAATANGSGTWDFTDPGTTNLTRCFYRLSWP